MSVNDRGTELDWLFANVYGGNLARGSPEQRGGLAIYRKQCILEQRSDPLGVSLLHQLLRVSGLRAQVAITQPVRRRSLRSETSAMAMQSDGIRTYMNLWELRVAARSSTVLL